MPINPKRRADDIRTLFFCLSLHLSDYYWLLIPCRDGGGLWHIAPPRAFCTPRNTSSPPYGGGSPYRRCPIWRIQPNNNPEKKQPIKQPNYNPTINPIFLPCAFCPLGCMSLCSKCSLADIGAWHWYADFLASDPLRLLSSRLHVALLQMQPRGHRHLALVCRFSRIGSLAPFALSAACRFAPNAASRTSALSIGMQIFSHRIPCAFCPLGCMSLCSKCSKADIRHLPCVTRSVRKGSDITLHFISSR